MAPGHVGPGPGLVDEDQSVRAERQLPLTPRGPRRSGRRAVLLTGVLGLLSRQPLVLEEATERRVAGPDNARREMATQLLDGRVGHLAHQREPLDRCGPYWSGSTVPRWRQRYISLTTKLTLTSNLAAVAPSGRASLDRAHHTRAQIRRVRLCDPSLASFAPAVSLNHKNRTL